MREWRTSDAAHEEGAGVLWVVACGGVGGVYSAGADGGCIRAEPAETITIGDAEGVSADGGVDEG